MLVAQCGEVAKNVSGDSVRKKRRGYAARIGEDVFLQPFCENRRNQRDQQKTPNPKQKCLSHLDIERYWLARS